MAARDLGESSAIFWVIGLNLKMKNASPRGFELPSGQPTDTRERYTLFLTKEQQRKWGQPPNPRRVSCDKAEAQIVVPVPRVVRVAVRRAAVLGRIVPAAAADNAIDAL